MDFPRDVLNFWETVQNNLKVPIQKEIKNALR